MNLGQYIKDKAEEKERNLTWVAEKMNQIKSDEIEEISYNTFHSQVNSEKQKTVTGINLLLAAIVLDINLEELKEKVMKISIPIEYEKINKIAEEMKPKIDEMYNNSMKK